jgi:hypothetical protein
MLSGAAALRDPTPVRHQTNAWFSDDGRRWSDAVPIGDPNVWLWRLTWQRGAADGIGHSTVGDPFIRLYLSTNGRTFAPLVEDLEVAAVPNETSILFPIRALAGTQDTALCLLRRDPAHGLLG